MPNYLEIIGEFYPTAQVHTTDDPTVYNSIQWSTTQISQAELDTVNLVKVKTNKILEFSEYAREDIVNGFESSALGFPHMYDSEPEDQLNLIGGVASETDVLFSARASSQGGQTVNVGGAVVGTDATGFANNTTAYLAEIQVDGVPSYLSIAGQDAQTYNDLITQLNADADFTLVGNAELKDGNVCISSSTYGSTSSINIVDSNLFSSLTAYVSLETAVGGVNAENAAKEFKNHTHTQLLQVLEDGKVVKTTALQKFVVKRSQIEAAADLTAVDAIVWE